MNKNKIITIKIDEELSLLLDEIKKDYSINLSNLVRKLLMKEFSNTNKYRRIKENV